MRPRWTPLLEHVLDFIFPRRCLGCGRTGDSLCTGCRSAPLFPAPSSCLGCAHPSPKGQTCAVCQNHWALSALHGGGVYEPHSLLVQAIHALKYRHDSLLAETLVDWLFYARPSLPPLLAQADFIVPVPLHPRRQRERGYNQSELLARTLSIRLNLPLLHGIERHRETFPQARCHQMERRINVQGAFRPILSDAVALQGQSVLLVDDVCSTGSTLQACALALKQAGASRVIGFVLARSVRPSGDAAILPS